MWAQAHAKPGVRIPEPVTVPRPNDTRKPNTVGWRTFGLMLRGG